ncbi:MAG: NAD(P)H-dependent oxidoreductase [Ferruginibacter sp.]|nr:NAD(P)H-dependent oxidoreductase [Ferruginibacter sp.]
MYLIISGTNRAGSNTLKVAKEYQRLLKLRSIDADLLSLEGLNLLKWDADFERIENEMIIPVDNYIFISPEYNGSFPGALKMLFDTGKTHAVWWHKKAMLTGVSTGRAGNLRGMDHLASVLNYVKVMVHPNQLPISSIDKLMDTEGHITDELTLKAINHQLDEFIKWTTPIA